MKNHGHHARPFLALPGERVTTEKSNQFSGRYKTLIVNSYNGSILQHVAQVLRSVQQTAQTDFSALVAVEDEVIVEARHQQIVSRAFAGTVAPDRPHLWKSRHQANRGLHRVHKTQRRAGISLAQGEGTRGEIRLKQRALDHRGHPRLPARRAIIFRTPPASWAAQAVTGPSKPFSTSRCSHSMRRCRSSCASSSRRPSRTTSVADPYAPLFTFSATKCLCRAVNATFITDVSLA